MANTPYTLIINGHHVQCDSPESVFALVRAASGGSASASSSSSAPASAPRKRRGRKPAAAVAAPPAAPKTRKGRKAGKRKGPGAPKAKGLSSRSVAFLHEFARSGGSVLTADRLAKATGAKGPKGVGGSLTALSRELKPYGYSLENLISRKKSLEDGTTWTSLPGCDRAVSEILSKVPQV